MIAVDELRQEFKLAGLLKLAGISKSNFYYILNKLKQPDKYAEIKELIKAIYHENKGRYGYRRITFELHNRGFFVNHKTVQRLMKQLGIQCFVRAKRYRSYKGTIGKICKNYLIVILKQKSLIKSGLQTYQNLKLMV